MKKIKDFTRGIKKGQRSFGESIGSIVNTIMLTFVYFVGVGPTFIVSRIFKKNFLEKKIDKNAKSYWKDLNLSKKKMEEYYRQF